MERDSSTEEEATARINSQLAITEKVKYADFVIDNSGSLSDLESQVNAFVTKVEAERGWIWLIGYFLPFISAFSAAWWLIRRRLRGSPTKRVDKQD
jgi:dephospho-CoA kinase